MIKIVKNTCTTLYLSIILLIGCTSFESQPVEVFSPSKVVVTNQPPVIKELEFESPYVSVCDSISFHCVAYDPDNDSLGFEWFSYKLSDHASQKYEILETDYHGKFASSGSMSIWRPGALKGRYLIIVKVSDRAGYQVTENVVMHVHHKLCEDIDLIFDIKMIGGYTLEEFTKYFKIVPMTIILSSFMNSKFKGIVQFDSIGTREIASYPEELDHINTFYTDCSDYYPEGKVVFTEIDISNDKMFGAWAVTAPTIDSDFWTFEAIRK